MGVLDQDEGPVRSGSLVGVFDRRDSLRQRWKDLFGPKPRQFSLRDPLDGLKIRACEADLLTGKSQQQYGGHGLKIRTAASISSF